MGIGSLLRRSSSASTRGALIVTATLTLSCAEEKASVFVDAGQQPAKDGGQQPAKDGGQQPESEAAVERTELSDVGTEPGLDYADRRLWLCRPGNEPDECNADLDATEFLPDGERKLVEHEPAEDPAIDCFYVYPTVKLSSPGPMTDFSKIDITLDPLLSQGARFNSLCRVYAPLYRQNGVVPGAGGAPTVDGQTTFDLGFEDVRDAFKYYIEKLNKGRKFVLIGHSQGSGALTNMTKKDIDPDAKLRGQMLSALLIGASVTVPDGEVVGGTFENIPLCTEPGQLGCVIAYNSFTKEIPPNMATFGRSPKEGESVACTEPAALAGRPGERYQGSYVRMKRINPTLSPEGFDQLPTDIDTPFVVYRDVLRGECKNENGYSWLEISLEMPEDDPRPPPPYRSPAIEPALGLHLVDYNLELDDLIEAVRLQAKAAAK